MRESKMLMTEAEVRLAIEYWFNRKIAQAVTYTPHPVNSVKAMPHSDKFCLSVQFDGDDK